MVGRRGFGGIGGRLADGGLLALLAGFGLLFGFGRHEVHRFERKAAEEIASKLEGPDKKVTVRTELHGPLDGPLGHLQFAEIRAERFSTEGLPLFTEPERSKKGIVERLRIVLDDFRLKGLRVEHLEADIPDCRYDFALALKKGQIRLSRSGVGTGSVRIRQEDLEAFILHKFREIKRVRVRIERGKAFVDGYGEFLLVQTEFSVIADLVPDGGSKLVLANAKVYFDGVRTDEFSREAVLDLLNPVVDLDRDLGLYGAVSVEGLRLEGGVLEAWGKTRIPERPK